jgi:hypothetical protein
MLNEVAESAAVVAATDVDVGDYDRVTFYHTAAE